MADSLRLELRVSREWMDRLDAVRGSVPRGTFLKGLVPTAVPADNLPPRTEDVRAFLEDRKPVFRPEVPSCPECAGDFEAVDGRWVCGDCGRPR